MKKITIIIFLFISFFGLLIGTCQANDDLVPTIPKIYKDKGYYYYLLYSLEGSITHYTALVSTSELSVLKNSTSLVFYCNNGKIIGRASYSVKNFDISSVFSNLSLSYSLSDYIVRDYHFVRCFPNKITYYSNGNLYNNSDKSILLKKNDKTYYYFIDDFVGIITYINNFIVNVIFLVILPIFILLICIYFLPLLLYKFL